MGRAQLEWWRSMAVMVALVAPAGLRPLIRTGLYATMMKDQNS